MFNIKKVMKFFLTHEVKAKMVIDFLKNFK